MKAVHGLLLFIALFLSLQTLAYADCSSGSCPDSVCSSCECTDIVCGPRGGNDCLSKSECCEAFGNVGAR